MDELIFTHRVDLIKGLPRGAQTRMTKILDTTVWNISKVLHGHLNANTENNRHIIVLAEQIVEREKQKQNQNNG